MYVSHFGCDKKVIQRNNNHAEAVCWHHMFPEDAISVWSVVSNRFFSVENVSRIGSAVVAMSSDRYSHAILILETDIYMYSLHGRPSS